MSLEIKPREASGTDQTQRLTTYMRILPSQRHCLRSSAACRGEVWSLCSVLCAFVFAAQLSCDTGDLAVGAKKV